MSFLKPHYPSPLHFPKLPFSPALCRSTKWSPRLLADFLPIPLPSITSLPTPPPLPISNYTLPIPLNPYRILNTEPHFLPSSIAHSHKSKLSSHPHPSFSETALAARREFLNAASQTLCDPGLRGEYNRGVDRNPDGVVDVPVEKVAGALCVLREAGEAEMVVGIGGRVLKGRVGKDVKQDLVLVMVLSYVDLSRDKMAAEDVVGCCEVLERALRLLEEEGARNLAPDLHAQIDETLEAITPHCVLELLALPLDEEHHVKREEGLIRIRSILSSIGGGGAAAIGGGFTREELMNEAFTRMTAAEQVELFAAAPSNIPRESFEVYGVALALIAQAFIGRNPHLIKEADNLLLQLQEAKVTPLGDVSDFTERDDPEVEFALERGLCSLLVGDLEGCRSWLGVDSEKSPYRTSAIIDFVMDNSNLDNETDLLPGLCLLLETWLMEEVFPRFRDTQDVRFKLKDYYDDPIVLRYLERMDGDGRSPLAAAAAIVKIGAEATVALGNAKSRALQAFRKVFPYASEGRATSAGDYDRVGDTTVTTDKYDSASDSETAGNRQSADPNEPDFIKELKKLTVMIISGSALVGLLTLAALRLVPGRNALPVAENGPGSAMAADVANLDVPDDESLLLEMPKMDANLAEALVHKWQNIKSQALGPEHCVEQLPEVLEGKMLKIWTDRAGEIAQQGWFWEYTLLDVSIDSLIVSSDGRHAMVEVTIEEAARLTDPAHPENDDSSSTTYMTKYEMSYCKSGWKITEGAVLKSLR